MLLPFSFSPFTPSAPCPVCPCTSSPVSHSNSKNQQPFPPSPSLTTETVWSYFLIHHSQTKSFAFILMCRILLCILTGVEKWLCQIFLFLFWGFLDRFRPWFSPTYQVSAVQSLRISINTNNCWGAKIVDGQSNVLGLHPCIIYAWVYIASMPCDCDWESGGWPVRESG